MKKQFVNTILGVIAAATLIGSTAVTSFASEENALPQEEVLEVQKEGDNPLPEEYEAFDIQETVEAEAETGEEQDMPEIAEVEAAEEPMMTENDDIEVMEDQQMPETIETEEDVKADDAQDAEEAEEAEDAVDTVDAADVAEPVKPVELLQLVPFVQQQNEEEIDIPDVDVWANNREVSKYRLESGKYYAVEGHDRFVRAGQRKLIKVVSAYEENWFGGLFTLRRVQCINCEDNESYCLYADDYTFYAID